jgi:serine/threonine protein kinase
MTESDDWTNDEVRLADLLEQGLQQLEQGRPVDVPFAADEPAGVLLADLLLVLRAVDGLRAEQSQLVGALLEETSLEAPSGKADALPDPFPGEFRVRSLLGRGAFGAVWLADDLYLERPVALKALSVADGGRLALLREEARALAAVEHRHVVRVYAWREGPDGTPYLILQYIAGGSLADRVAREGPLHWREAGRAIADVGEGLLAVHAQGIVHRDVKPANLLWDHVRGEALLTDFGTSARLSDDGTIGGTPYYMPPEAFDGVVGPAQDVYALAASLFWLITGSAPYPGPTRVALAAQARRGLPAHDPRCAVLPEPIENLVRAGLSADLGRRPALADFVASLRAALNQLLTDAFRRPGSNLGEGVRLLVSRRLDRHTYAPVTATRTTTASRLRDVQLVPDEPDRMEVRTGERLRIEVEVDRPGYVTVFNVGPTGNLTRLHPPPGGRPAAAEPRRPQRIGETVLTLPAGRERLVAVWSREPLTVQLADVLGQVSAPGPYRATRDIALLEESVHALPADAWHAAVVELDHRPPVEEHP